jgi:DNA-binding beta-propeller fold protein YncE
VFGSTLDGGLQSQCVSGLGLSSPALAAFSLLPQGIEVAAAAHDEGVVFANLTALQNCNVAGYLVGQGPGAGTLGVAVTPDQAYAFAANEYGVAPAASTLGSVGVIKLQFDQDGGVTAGTQVLGQISTGGNGIAGILLSPDGHRLYVTSEIAVSGTTASGGSNPVLARTGCVQRVGSPSTINGLLTVIDVSQAETAPGPGAILATIDAACSPVRIAESADQSVLWVTARGDDRVLAFDPSLLETNPDSALIGYAATGGTAPVGLVLFHNDQLLAVANSNRFGTGTANMTILDVTDPTKMSVLQTVSTGLFPREITVGSDDATLYLTDFASSFIQVIQTTVN